MAAAVGLTDVTPQGYRRASSNDSEPAPGDLAALAGGGFFIVSLPVTAWVVVLAVVGRRGRQPATPLVDAHHRL